MDGKTLLAAIIADPDDDLARLAYADWAEENGDTDRATFIRLQVRSAQIAESFQIVPGQAEYVALEAQAKELLRGHEEWKATLPLSLRQPKKVGFRRGFVAALDLPVKQLLAVSARVWATHPIQEVKLANDATGQLGLVLAVPHMPRVRKWVLFVQPTEQDLAALSTTDRLFGLRELWLGRRSDRVIDAIAACPSLRGLTRLGFTDQTDPEAFARFAASDNVVNLAELRVDSGLSKGGAEVALTRSPALAALRRLVVQFLGDAGVAALAGCPHLSGLRWLSVRRCRLTPAGVEALARSPHLTRLRILELDHNAFGPAGVRAMAGPAWGELQRLDLAECELGDEGVAALADCGSLPALSSLSLQFNKITAEGVRALVISPHSRNLTYLSLYSNKIGDEGALALCESRCLDKLERLRLQSCGPFSPATQAALHERFGARVRL